MPVSEFCVNGLILYMLFCVWLLLLDIMELYVAEIQLFSRLYDIPLYATLQFMYPFCC